MEYHWLVQHPSPATIQTAPLQSEWHCTNCLTTYVRIMYYVQFPLYCQYVHSLINYLVPVPSNSDVSSGLISQPQVGIRSQV